MGANLSLRLFEFVNDIHITIGSGMLGLLMIAWNGAETHTFRSLFVAGATIGCFAYALTGREHIRASTRKVIVISGCDSGLGFSLAHHACEIGFTVIAGCLSAQSKGAVILREHFNDQIIVIEIDITKIDSIESTVAYAERYLNENQNHDLHALINNAGVMVFGEFEWLTERLILNQIHVNLTGTMNITKQFLPLLRKYSGRVITVTSHCANATLPGLAVYGATKAALSAWSDGLRVEVAKYGVPVLTFIPGSFIQQSNIMARQNENVYEMQSTLNEEQFSFYGDYFKDYYVYLSALSGVRKPQKIDDSKMYDVFENALLDKDPAATYKHETWKYAFYHFLFRVSPTKLRDALIVSFIQMPKWKREKRVRNILA